MKSSETFDMVNERGGRWNRVESALRFTLEAIDIALLASIICLSNGEGEGEGGGGRELS